LRSQGFEELWNVTHGSSKVTIAILDGPIDFGHPCLSDANIQEISLFDNGPAPSSHGTAIAGLIFAVPGEQMRGIAPGCSGFSIPIWNGDEGAISPCSQEALGYAIRTAVDLGADIINISGGELIETGPHPVLEGAIAYCQDHNVLVVAAVGNDGCCCPHLPAAIPSVLAVGAMDIDRRPLPFSNWAPVYRDSGLLAPGTELVAPRAGGGYVKISGTSYATAIVSGAAALLLSLEAELGADPDPLRVRRLLLETASPCDEAREGDCDRFLAGRMDIPEAVREIKLLAARQITAFQHIQQTLERGTIPREETVSEETNTSMTNPSELAVDKSQNRITGRTVNQASDGLLAAGLDPSDCGCGCGAGSSRFVYAIGTLGYDFGSRARQESFAADMSASDIAPEPYQAQALLSYIERNPPAAADVIWTLNIDGVPIYSIAPVGPFADRGYATILGLFAQQNAGPVQRVAVPGSLGGNVRLLNGAHVPVVHPALRGVFGFNAATLVDAALQPVPDAQRAERRPQFQSFFDRFFYELRNLGASSSERAINFAGATIFRMGDAFTSKIAANLALHRIEVAKSSVCPPDGDCWDVSLSFFDPRHMLDHAREVFRFAVDVSYEIPVRVGPVNSWATHSVGL
jgi:cyanobactin maturation PatA/PatG family protease